MVSRLPTAEAPAKTGRAQVYYDGHCRLCQKSVAMLKRLDWLGRLEYVDVRNPDHPALRLLPAANGELLNQMHLLTPGHKVHQGFYAFRWMAWRLPLLWLVAPFLYLPGMPSIGQRVYLWVARNRFRLIPCHGGVCTIEKHQETTGEKNEGF